MKVIAKDQQGIEIINDLLRDTSKMNDRIRNLFEWPEKRKKHIRYNNSFLYYMESDHYFRFISELKYSTHGIMKWSEYVVQNDPVLIRDDQGTFMYCSHEPHIVVVSQADWLFKKDEIMNNEFRKWIYKAYDKEREIWREKLSSFHSSSPLF